MSELQNAEFVRLMKTAGQGGAPSEESFVRAITAVEIETPARARSGFGAAQGLERYAPFAPPYFGLVIHLDGRLEMAAPGEVPFRQTKREIQFLIGGSYFVLSVMF